MKYSDIELAFDFVSSDQECMNTAYISKSTGQSYYHSEMYGEMDDIPDDIDDNDDYIEIPHKNDLDLGQNLVWQFVNQEIPGLVNKVRDFFSRRGAYSRYKKFLEEIGLLDKWFEFENNNSRKALLEWCKENEIKVD